MELKILKKCSETELIDWAKEQWEEFTSLLNRAVLFLPANDQKIDYSESDFQVKLADGSVTVVPEAFQAKSIGGIRERPGWLITTWKWTDETEHEAAELIPHEEQQSSHNMGAVYFAMKHTFDVAMMDFANKYDAEQQAKELNENDF